MSVYIYITWISDKFHEGKQRGNWETTYIQSPGVVRLAFITNMSGLHCLYILLQVFITPLIGFSNGKCATK